MRKFMIVAGIAGLAVAMSAPVAGAQESDAKAFCKAAFRADNLVTNAPFDEGPDAEEPDPDDVAKWQKQLDKALTKAERTAPTEVADAVTTAAAVFRQSAETGDDPFSNPELESAIMTIDEYRFTSCGYEQLEVTATEYAFSGIPETLDAGTVAIKFTNEGAELHELVLFRFKTDDSIHDLLELDPEEAQSKVVDVGFGFAGQNETGYVFAKVKKAGRYGAGCFVPVGTLTEADFETAEGPPHAVEGMTTEFTVDK